MVYLDLSGMYLHGIPELVKNNKKLHLFPSFPPVSAHRYQGTHQGHAALAPEDVGGQVSPLCHSHVLLCLMVANSV